MDSGALRFAIGAWVLVTGATIGSFLNVVIARVPAGESVVRPRSRCPGCRAPIAWYDNIPVVSWLVLRGRCRRCGARISPRYVMVELLGAAAAWLAWQRQGLGLSALAELAFVDVLIALAFIDLATWLLPNVLTRPLVVAGLVAAALGAAPAASLRSSVLGAALGYGAFAAVAWVGKILAKREAMGTGDVWLLAGLGAWLGVGALVPVVLLASLQGSAYGLLLIALGRAERGPQPVSGPSGPIRAHASAPSADPAGAAEPALPPPAGGPVPGVEGAPRPEVASDDDWVPPRYAVPFGPFLVAGGLEWLYLSASLGAWLPGLDVFG